MHNFYKVLKKQSSRKQLPDSRDDAVLKSCVFQAEKLDDKGMVIDYGELKPIKDYLDQYCDHSVLNKVMFCYPTAENIAKYLFDYFQVNMGFRQLIEVRVSETDKTWASYKP